MAGRESLGSTRRIQRGDVFAHIVEVPSLVLVVVDGPDLGHRAVRLEPAIRIGTAADNDLVVTDSTVSRHHARLTRTDQGYSLVDLKSKNGTFVRGVRITEALLEPGMEFSVGCTRLRVDPGTREYLAMPEEDDRLGGLVGASRSMREVYSLIRAVAETPITVLVEGESGCGKELVARALHQMSGRKGPFVAFDCSSTGPDLIRSELFGHQRGAFTGASEAREGALRRAHHGTLLLDELGDLPVALQVMLLRVLETREVQPVGSDSTVAVDVRIVAATNQDLEKKMTEGLFRPELFHRLSVVRIALPPLRDRAEDIPLLVRHFQQACGWSAQLPQEVLDRLVAHPWPGNVRELRNAIERLAVLCRTRPPTVRDLALSTPQRPPPGAGDLESLERQAILEALEKTGGNRAAAARLLKIGLTTLKRKLKEYGAD